MILSRGAWKYNFSELLSYRVQQGQFRYFSSTIQCVDGNHWSPSFLLHTCPTTSDKASDWSPAKTWKTWRASLLCQTCCMSDWHWDTPQKHCMCVDHYVSSHRTKHVNHLWGYCWGISGMLLKKEYCKMVSLFDYQELIIQNFKSIAIGFLLKLNVGDWRVQNAQNQYTPYWPSRYQLYVCTASLLVFKDCKNKDYNTIKMLRMPKNKVCYWISTHRCNKWRKH